MIRRLARDESGMVIIMAIILLTVLLGVGLAVVQFADGQQRASGRERRTESSYQLAEAALNAQIFQLGRSWPTATAPATSPCTPASAAGTTCPDASGLSNGYNTADYTSTGCAQPLWKTVVQDDTNGTRYYDPTSQSASAYDANSDNAVWVRAYAAPQCRKQSVVALVTRSLTQMSFPKSVANADWIKTTNAGKKVIVNRTGPDGTAGDVLTRCTASGHTTPASCVATQSTQISPPLSTTQAGPNPALTEAQLDSLRQQAKAANTWYPGCPASYSLSSPSTGPYAGAPVFIEGTSSCVVSGNGNSAANPGVLVLYDGKYAGTGGANFYGVLYAHNNYNPPTGLGSSAAMVTLSGCAQIVGVVNVDGPGGVDVGSCKQNLVYNPTAITLLRTYGGAMQAPNTFRVLRPNDP